MVRIIGYRYEEIITLLHILNSYINIAITVLPAKSDSDFMFCLQSYQELIIDSSLVY